MKERYFVQLSYKGTNYHGWQVQPNALTVQEVLTKAFSTILREDISLIGAGRTDTGVHARFFVAHFNSNQQELDKDLKLIFKLNSFLPRDIAIFRIVKVNPEAHARFDAMERTYRYYIHQRKDVFLNNFSWYLPVDLNVEMMNKAARILLQYEDFTSFSKVKTDVKTNICKIQEAKWSKDDYRLIFTIRADRFLRNMVRAIVGTLVDVGKENITLEDFKKIIENRNRAEAGTSVAAHGLFLEDIRYPQEIYQG
ncbi:MAG: tRNA pseudouridine(38-40) synthase TruA [Bacteroidales bacterium]|nr:tRNA pseudouridine(38-40) synthase TruA [Bacteroidales bacterium]